MSLVREIIYWHGWGRNPKSGREQLILVLRFETRTSNMKQDGQPFARYVVHRVFHITRNSLIYNEEAVRMECGCAYIGTLHAFLATSRGQTFGIGLGK